MGTVLSTWVTDTMRALAFLSRVPVHTRWFAGFNGRYDRAARAFPLAGALIALPSALGLLVLDAIGVSPLATALVAIGSSLVLTGALHEDGLADFADGLAGRTPEQRIAIMRDSAIGAYGVLALVVVVGLRAALVAELIADSPALAASALVGSDALSRAATVTLWARTEPASAAGVAVASGQPQPRVAFLAGACALAISLPTLVLRPYTFLVGIVLLAVVTGALVRDANKRLGGHTGDVLGATAVLSGTAFLLALAID